MKPVVISGFFKAFIGNKDSVVNIEIYIFSATLKMSMEKSLKISKE
jgi:hypothetical protein